MPIDDAHDLIGQPEGAKLEYKLTLPPASVLAKHIAAFANAEGGWLVIGVREGAAGPEIVGLSRDVPAQSAVDAALLRLSPRPSVRHGITVASNKELYVLEVQRSAELILTENGRIFRRVGEQVREAPPPEVAAIPRGKAAPPLPAPLKELLDKIKACGVGATESQLTMLRQYERLAQIVAEARELVCPEEAATPPTLPHGRALTRLVFSSFADTFERYLSDILIEVHYAQPNTLKSEAPFTAKDVLDCSDMTEVIALIANRRVGALQKGSADDFVKYLRKTMSVELFLPIEGTGAAFASSVRNLYVHSNGIADEKFLRHTAATSMKVGDERSTSVKELCETADLFLGVSKRLDGHVVHAFGLSTYDI